MNPPPRHPAHPGLRCAERRAFLRGFALAMAPLAASVGIASAGWQDEIGYTRLKAELGSSTPNGFGIDFAQVEGPSGGPYLATGGSTNPIAGADNLSGKSIYDRSQTNSSQSIHARTVAYNICSNVTSPSQTNSSVAPAILEFDNWEADDWLDNQIKYQSSAAPAAETRDLQNHSWIGSLESTADDNEILRRLDHMIERDDFLVFAGVNNGADTSVPPLLGSAYNVVSVGVSDGDHSRGGTPSGIDGPGRIKPEIVAPHNVTSYATGRVTGVTSLLLQTIDANPALSNARNSEATKAILLAGASKTEFPSWSRTSTRPLDSVYGAGELDIYNSYHILTGGEHGPGSGAFVPARGWDFRAHASSSIQSYTFEVPVGYKAEEVSILLTWHRTISDSSPGPAFVPNATLEALDLTLFQSVGFVPGVQLDSSVSADHNVEHIYQTELPAGEYTFQVTGSGGKDYGLAWRVELAPLLDIAGITVEEGEGIAEFLVTLPSPHHAEAGFDYSTKNGTALAGSDFTPTMGSATIPVGQTSVVVSVPIVDDTLQEDEETFVLKLSNARGTDLGNDSATAIIEDNDPPPFLFISGPGAATESVGDAILTMELSGASGLDVTFTLATDDASAKSPDDFLAATALLTIPAGATSVPLALTINDDDEPEANEKLSLTLSNAQNASIVGAPFTLTIIDDDVSAKDMEPASLDLEFPNGVASLEWAAIPGRIYTIESSTDLITWVALASATRVTATNALETAQDNAATGVRRFYRILDVTMETGAP